MPEVGGIDPADHSTLSGFKTAFYAENGAGSWLDDAKLQIVYLQAHDRDVPAHLRPLLGDDDAE